MSSTETMPEVVIAPQAIEKVKLAVAAAEDKKAIEVVVLKLVELTAFADFFVICSGGSTRQVQAIVDEVEASLKRHDHRPLNIEGYNNAEWVLMDYGSVVVHVFSQDSRRFYDLERLWRDAERVNAADLK